MAEITQDTILDTLRQLPVPGMSGDPVSLGMVSSVLLNEGKVIFSMNVPAEKAEALEPMRLEAERRIAALPGVEKVTIVLTAEKKPGTSKPTPPPAQQHRAPQGGGGPRAGVPGIEHIVAVASGKGGVG